MKICRALITTALLVLVPTLAANAAVLYTAPLGLSQLLGSMSCNIVNVGDTTETVTIEGVDSNGTVISVPLTKDILPGHAIALIFASPVPTSGEAYCKFTVPGKLSGNFRASMQTVVVSTTVNGIPFTVELALPAF